MATTVNNTTVNTKLTIIFDAGINPSSENNGPVSGTGNTESDVIIDNKSYLNLRSHTEIDANVHALQWNAITNTGELEYIDNRENESLSSLPQWVANVVIRCEAEDIYTEAYNTAYTNDASAGQDDDSAAIAVGQTAGSTARTNYLTANGITY